MQVGGIRDILRARARTPLPGALIGRLTLIKVVLDLSAWAAAIGVAAWVRLAMVGTGIEPRPLLRTIAFVWVAQTSIGTVQGLYRGRWRYGSFDEVAAVVRVTVLGAVVMVLLERPFRPRTPVSAMVVGACIALLLMVGVRYVWRMVMEIRRSPDPGADGITRLLVFGAGDRGCGMIDELMTAKDGLYIPVGFIDDDPTKRRFSARGVKVLGTLQDLAVVAREHRASALLVAITSVPPELMAELLAQADRCQPPLKVKVLMPLSSLFGERARERDIRDLSEEDLLGRRRIETDLDSIAHYIRNKRVLVTGAGGSIGSELCRQLKHFQPARLAMLDHDESALHGVQLSIENTALLDSPDLVLADLRDADRILQVFKDIRPEVVFHAAALKHLPLLEANPGEAVKSNIWGTQIVLEAAMGVGVERFVNISTDKAADPCNVLGYSKRIAERLTAYAALTAATGTYVSVRFGNVLGSRGSVLTTFRQQVSDGVAVTVTHPDVTRYFMLTTEAVQLVIQAGAIGNPGEVLVLDMGEPVRIGDVAKALIRRSGKSISVTYTGMRPGEKLHETLLGEGELDFRPVHPLVTHAQVPPMAPSWTHDLDVDDKREQINELLRNLCAVGPPSLPSGGWRPVVVPNR